MVSLVLSVALMTSSGGLLAERAPAAGLLLGQAPAFSPVPLEQMSIAELTEERGRLQASMPSMALGITLTAVGGGVLLTGLIIMAAAFYVEVLLVGLVIAAAAVPLLIIGPINIGRAARERRATNDRIRWIDQRIAQLNRDGMAPQMNETPPPPPPMPPGAWLPNTVPQVLVATF